MTTWCEVMDNEDLQNYANGVKRIYLDYNATTPVASEVFQSITTTLQENWENPSSDHIAGRAARKVIEDARQSVADMIGADSSEIIFTSGGTEANNLVIHSAIEDFKVKRHCTRHKASLSVEKPLPHIITTNIEHDSIRLPLEHRCEKGEILLTTVPVSKVTGQVEVGSVFKEITASTCLVTVILANNETGIIQPVSEIGEALQLENEKRSQSKPPQPVILLHTDAAQAIGKIPVSVKDLCVDYLTVVGHKFYGPRIGALYIYNRSYQAPLYPMLFGGGQERSYRPGTENTAMIVGLGMAACLVREYLEKYRNNMEITRDYLESQLKETFGEDVVFNNHCARAFRLPNTCSVAFRGSKLTGHAILQEAKCIQAGTGAACHKSTGLSSVLLHSGINEEDAAASLRLTTGRETTKEHIDDAVVSLSRAVQKLKK